MPLLSNLRTHWQSEAGPREVLALALPLFLSTCSMTVQVFVDRMFLTWYSAGATAAAIPAVCVLWVLLGPLNGIVSFANTFVAQYHGAGRPERIGPAVGQAILFAVAGGAAMLTLAPAARFIFGLVGHDPAVVELEAVYFQTILVSAAPMLVMNAVACFFGGLGRTWVVLWLNVVATVVNIVLDYAMIFGHWGFPEWGIAGAGLATSIGYFVAAGLSLVLLWAADEDGRYGVRRCTENRRVGRVFEAHQLSVDDASHDGGASRRLDTPYASTAEPIAHFLAPDAELFRRLLRFGGPNGLMVFVDVLAWTWFVLLTGRLGMRELAASNVAFNINMFAFGPIMGVGTAVQILVGQRLGEGRPELAARSTWSAFWLAFVYTAMLGAGYLFAPDLFLLPFRANTAPEEFAVWSELVPVLLRYVTIYALFDMAAFLFASALRGAGDTRFVMVVTLGLALGVMVVPSYVAVEILSANLFVTWCFVAAYVMALGGAFFARFQSGVWRSMRVIETVPLLPESDLCPDEPSAQPVCSDI